MCLAFASRFYTIYTNYQLKGSYPSFCFLTPTVCARLLAEQLSNLPHTSTLIQSRFNPMADALVPGYKMPYTNDFIVCGFMFCECGLEYCYQCPRDHRDCNNIANEAEIARKLPKDLPEEDAPDQVRMLVAAFDKLT